jgi:hypothetical protein
MKIIIAAQMASWLKTLEALILLLKKMLLARNTSSAIK